MTITIRPAVIEDVAAVRYVGTVTWPATYGADRGAAYVIRGLDEYWSAEAIGSAIQAGNIDVAVSGDAIVGMVQVGDVEAVRPPRPPPTGAWQAVGGSRQGSGAAEGQRPVDRV